MRKLILLFCIALFCISCDPPQNAWDWSIKNCTEQTLIIKFPEYSIHDNGTPVYRTIILQQNQAAFIHGSHTSKKRGLNFGYFFNTIVDRYGENIYWQILSEDDTVLKTWNYSDKRLPDQRFFEESSWKKEQGPGSGFTITEFLWTFEIQPEDISSN